jgi:hypothetical protein
MFRLGFPSIVITVLLSASAFAGTYAVGTCQPNVPFYSTIQDAVTSVPAGSTILVCPGNYAEQVVISQPLTLKGMAGESDAIVSVPPGGLMKSVTPSGFVKTRYQILVQNTTGPVDVSNLAVDGTGGGGSQRDIVAGIFYVDSTGTVSHVSARNQPDFGVGIMAMTSAPAAQTVTVQNSVMRGLTSFGSFGIVAYGVEGAGALTTYIKGNTIRGFNGSGIQVYRATGTVQSNAISGTPYGIELIGSSVTATGNTISTGFIAMDVLSGSNTIKRNKVDAGGQTGMILFGDATNSVVQGNTIANSTTAVSGCMPGWSSFSYGFTVTGNTITDATVGMQMPSSNRNITTPNNYYATATAVSAQPCF